MQIPDIRQQKLSVPGTDLHERIDLFRKFPYKYGVLRRRNWGHSLHSLCSYPSKIKPSIAHILVTYFSEKGNVVLDPFSGSGTIPLEACLNGRVGIGSDLSIFAFHLTRAKVNPPDRTQLSARMDQLAEFVSKESVTGEEVESVPSEIRNFYEKRTFEEVLKARKFLLKYSERDPSNSFLVASIAHLLHGNRPYALSRRSHNMFPIPPKGDFVYKPLMKALTDKVARVFTELSSDFVEGEAFYSPAAKIPVDRGSVDIIVTSPPFLGTTDFLRHNRIRLWFSGWDYDGQEERKSTFLEQALGIDSYRPVLEEFQRVLKPGALAILHLGVVKKRDMATELLPIAQGAGFKALDTVYEDTSEMESYGRTDRGSTHKHQFVFLQR